MSGKSRPLSARQALQVRGPCAALQVHPLRIDSFSCIAASEDAARVQNFYSARYDVQPRFYEGRTLQVRGLMRVEDRRGYRILDTVCDVDADGEVERFAFLR